MGCDFAYAETIHEYAKEKLAEVDEGKGGELRNIEAVAC